MFHILSFNLVELTEAYENKGLDSFPMIDLSVAKNIKNDKFSLDTLSSLASNTSIKDIHTQMIKTIDSIVPMKQDSMSVLCRDSKYLLKCPFKGIYGFVNATFNDKTFKTIVDKFNIKFVYDKSLFTFSGLAYAAHSYLCTKKGALRLLKLSQDKPKTGMDHILTHNSIKSFITTKMLFC